MGWRSEGKSLARAAARAAVHPGMGRASGVALDEIGRAGFVQMMVCRGKFLGEPTSMVVDPRECFTRLARSRIDQGIISVVTSDLLPSPA